MPHHRRFFMALTALLAFATLLSIARADTGNTVYLPLLVSDGSGQGQAPVPTDLTATATSTATATATTTPTEPCTGVYPIGIDTATITGDTFNNLGVDTTNPNEYKVLSNGQIQRRLYVTTDSMPGGFAYLRWNESFAPGGIPATSGQALVNSLSGEGNYGSGFEEAPWPVLGTAPVDYPNQPGALNAGDWIWGTPGWKDSTGATGVPAALDAQIVTGRPMRRPPARPV
ncbi:hypothetical protein K2Z83_10495 [Oscillochloris sp. ZM17-4]|uniref:hypothetical protein n=1 Tax=Oscillochloris sp. ZM17-4 TaxID=2866714 RepID=UPI001C73549B|nr:hypothetical protein [Oscillochloris sp. ZM17-4]MBX0328106.1 hypothetical protein [Oscillochloris sp. ZM17-4]